MAASVIEQTLARMATVLAAGVPAVAGRVYRGRVDALGDSEMPALVLSRGETAHESLGDSSERIDLDLHVHCFGAGAAWETVVDDLAVTADAALQADAQVANLCNDLRLRATAPEGAAGTRGPVGRLTLKYETFFATPLGLMSAVLP